MAPNSWRLPLYLKLVRLFITTPQRNEMQQKYFDKVVHQKMWNRWAKTLKLHCFSLFVVYSYPFHIYWCTNWPKSSSCFCVASGVVSNYLTRFATVLESVWRPLKIKWTADIKNSFLNELVFWIPLSNIFLQWFLYDEGRKIISR